jgi:hypothetical protein
MYYVRPRLRRARFGQSSEQMDSGQLPLTLEELTAAVAEAERADTAFKAAEAVRFANWNFKCSIC